MVRGKHSHSTSLNCDTRGTSTLELAVILPFLMTLGFGAYEFGNLIYNYHLITVGVRDAARYLAGSPRLEDLPGGDKIEAAKNIALRGTIDPNANPRISWWTGANTVFTIHFNPANGGGPYRGGDTVRIVTVIASVPYDQLGFLEFLRLGPITLTASHEERVYQNR